MPTVTALTIAPVKALAATPVDRVRLDTDGVAEDRRLFLVDAEDTVVTQRRYPHLTRVIPHLDLTAGTITIDLPGDGETLAELSTAGQPVRTTLFGKERSGRVVPGPVADALSDYVGERLRLVLAERIGVGCDEGPVSLIGRASADAVSAPAERGSPTTARFRMLVEFDGTVAYQEDAWVGQRLQVGSALLSVTHRLERCVVINHSPRTGRHDWSGLKTIAELRGRDRIMLGVIASVEQPGEIRLGDCLAVRGAPSPAGGRAG
jgi:uncharacterized protein